MKFRNYRTAKEQQLSVVYGKRLVKIPNKFRKILM